MKKIIRGVVIPLFVAILFGMILGRYAFRTYRGTLMDTLTSRKLYLLENGEYETFEDMREDNSTYNYIYYYDDNKYKSVIGITRNYDNISKIKSIYGDNLRVTEYYLPNDKIDYRQDEYDLKLFETTDINEMKGVMDDILGLYHSEDKTRLIGFN